MNREKMLMDVRIAYFKMVESNLYLDTHPACRHAAAYFQDAQTEFEKALAAYEEAFGPLMVTAAGGKPWNWIETPWPWQSGAC